MRPVTVTVGPLAAASANNIAQPQTIAAAGALAINGSTANNGVATLDMPRRVAIASAGNDSGISFTIAGTGRNGAQSETVTGGNAGAVSSALDYLTISSVTASGATASTVQAGTSSTGSSALVRMDEYAASQLGGQVSANGTATWIVEGSFDDPNSQTNPVPVSAMVWLPVQDSAAGPTISSSACPLWLRATITAGAGSVRATFTQYAELSSLS